MNQVDEARICAVCGLILIRLGGRTGYVHSIDQPLADHPAVPVSFAEAGEVDVFGVPLLARPRCDFCSTESGDFNLPADDFWHLGGHSGGDWAACPECAVLIAVDDWSALRTRSLRLYRQAHPEIDLAHLVTFGTTLDSLWADLRRHITGPVQHISKGFRTG